MMDETEPEVKGEVEQTGQPAQHRKITMGLTPWASAAHGLASPC